MMMTMLPVPCVWAVGDDLTTLFASPSFARLVGINRLVLTGLPWFVVLPRAGQTALDWLAHTSQPSPSAILEIRHLEGQHIRVLLRRVSGGPGQDKAVFSVVPLDYGRAATILDAASSSGSERCP